MTRAICQLEDVAIRGEGFGRRYGRGAVVDLDERIGVTRHGAPVTLRDCLGPLVQHFVLLDPDPPVMPSPAPFDVADDGDAEEGL